MPEGYEKEPPEVPTVIVYRQCPLCGKFADIKTMEGVLLQWEQHAEIIRMAGKWTEREYETFRETICPKCLQKLEE